MLLSVDNREAAHIGGILLRPLPGSAQANPLEDALAVHRKEEGQRLPVEAHEGPHKAAFAKESRRRYDDGFFS